MATDANLHQLAGLLGDLANSARLCEQLAIALIDVGRPWTWGGGIGSLLVPTEFERGRRQTMKLAARARTQIGIARLSVLSPHLIRAEREVKQLGSCCHMCLGENQAREARGEPFVCLLRQRFGDLAQVRFLLDVDNGGQIHESR